MQFCVSERNVNRNESTFFLRFIFFCRGCCRVNIGNRNTSTSGVLPGFLVCPHRTCQGLYIVPHSNSVLQRPVCVFVYLQHCRLFGVFKIAGKLLRSSPVPTHLMAIGPTYIYNENPYLICAFLIRSVQLRIQMLILSQRLAKAALSWLMRP